MGIWASGIDGFLGTRASLMLDVVFLAMFAVVPILAVSIGLARGRRQFSAHKSLQLVLASVLLVAVLAFELDMRFFTDWRARAVGSPYFAGEGWNAVWVSLVIHLSFAVPTLLLWIGLIVAALRHFPAPPVPGAHSATHRRFGWLAAIGMLLTSVTGWVFYYLAFTA